MRLVWFLLPESPVLIDVKCCECGPGTSPAPLAALRAIIQLVDAPAASASIYPHEMYYRHDGRMGVAAFRPLRAVGHRIGCVCSLPGAELELLLGALLRRAVRSGTDALTSALQECTAAERSKIADATVHDILGARPDATAGSGGKLPQLIKQLSLAGCNRPELSIAAPVFAPNARLPSVAVDVGAEAWSKLPLTAFVWGSAGSCEPLALMQRRIVLGVEAGRLTFRCTSEVSHCEHTSRSILQAVVRGSSHAHITDVDASSSASFASSASSSPYAIPPSSDSASNGDALRFFRCQRLSSHSAGISAAVLVCSHTDCRATPIGTGNSTSTPSGEVEALACQIRLLQAAFASLQLALSSLSGDVPRASLFKLRRLTLPPEREDPYSGRTGAAASAPFGVNLATPGSPSLAVGLGDEAVSPTSSEPVLVSPVSTVAAARGGSTDRFLGRSGVGTDSDLELTSRSDASSAATGSQRADRGAGGSFYQSGNAARDVMSARSVSSQRLELSPANAAGHFSPMHSRGSPRDFPSPTTVSNAALPTRTRGPLRPVAPSSKPTGWPQVGAVAAAIGGGGGGGGLRGGVGGRGSRGRRFVPAKLIVGDNSAPYPHDDDTDTPTASIASPAQHGVAPLYLSSSEGDE